MLSDRRGATQLPHEKMLDNNCDVSRKEVPVLRYMAILVLE